MSATDPLPLPGADDVRRVAQRLGVGIEPDELDAAAAQVRDLVRRALAFTDVAPSAERPQVRADRPFAEGNDSYRAFLTTCSIAPTADGPLTGMRISLKDHIGVAGLPLTLGSAMLRDHLADRDATIVTRLLANGATIVGKNNLNAFSLGEPSYLGKAVNPTAPDREPGGSSSGSAVAVAAGLADAAIGGDQGGSIRIPAAWCGVVGIKPTFGLVPHTGVVSGNDPLLDHVGPLARTVRDTALVLSCIAGPDGTDFRQLGVTARHDPAALLGRGVEGLRIGVLAEGFTVGEPAVADAARAAIDRLAAAGARVVAVSVPVHTEVQAAYFCRTLAGAFHQWQADLGTDLVRGELPISLLGALADTGWASSERRAPLVYRANVLAGALLFERHGAVLAARAHNARAAYRAHYDRVLADVDALVMPTIPIVPPQRDAPPDPGTDPLVRVHNTLPFDYTGHPAVTVPCHATGTLPIGLQVVGAHGDDATILRIAEVVERRGA